MMKREYAYGFVISLQNDWIHCTNWIRLCSFRCPLSAVSPLPLKVNEKKIIISIICISCATYIGRKCYHRTQECITRSDTMRKCQCCSRSLALAAGRRNRETAIANRPSVRRSGEPKTIIKAELFTHRLHYQMMNNKQSHFGSSFFALQVCFSWSWSKMRVGLISKREFSKKKERKNVQPNVGDLYFSENVSKRNYTYALVVIVFFCCILRFGSNDQVNPKLRVSTIS